jgi:hypothetical protein
MMCLFVYSNCVCVCVCAAAKTSGPEDKVGLEAAREIHVDTALHAIEVERTKFLAKMKLRRKEGPDTAAQTDTGPLITRNFAAGKKAQLAKMREMDDDVREFLGLDAYFARQERIRERAASVSSLGASPSTTDMKFLLGRNYGSGYRYDIWDVIIDRVAIMSVCRSDESRLLSKALAFDGGSFTKTVLDLSDHTIEGVVQSLHPSSQTAIGSRLTTPLGKQFVPAKSVKSSRGTPGISKNLRSEKGCASINAQVRSEVCPELTREHTHT